ncbi:MAG: pilus assembly protein, partial [Alphaproteobacteria bacterium]|nr:pilus assembly protein [Alphaproteobacteria bacterium]
MKAHRTFVSKFGHAGGRMRKAARSGSAAVEFALIAPVFFLFVFGIIETGVLFFAGGVLQNATNDVARLVRTGQLSGKLDAATLKADICGEMSGLIGSAACTANLEIDLRSYSNFSGASYPAVTNADGSLNTGAMAVDTTGDCQVVLIRAFYPWTILTPLMQPFLANMPSNQHLLAAAAAFRTEPYAA